METTCSLIGVNWLGVLVASVSAFALGAIWYSPLLFSKTWQREIKLSDEEIKSSNMLIIFGTAFILMFIGALVLDFILTSDSSVWNGLLWGLIIGMAWVSTSLGVTYLFARRSLKLYLIDAGYFIVLYAVMGSILGALK